MAHPRKLIRHAGVALMIAANTAAAGRVKSTRVDPHKPGRLPALAVYTLQDDVDPDASGTMPRERTNQLQLEWVGWVTGTDDNIADNMDDLAEQVEVAMDDSPYIADAGGNPTAVKHELVRTVMQVVEDNGASDPLVGIVVLRYLVTYRTTPAPAAATDDLLRIDAKQKLVGGVADTEQAEDLFNVRT